MKMRKCLMLVVFMTILSGCASMAERMPGYTHTAALVVGDTEANIVMQTKHILVSPKHVVYANKKTVNEIKIARFAFSDAYDLILYFHRGIFFQASLIEPNSNTYPFVRRDYKDVHKGSPGPLGYMITLNGKALSINTLWRKGEKPKE